MDYEDDPVRSYRETLLAVLLSSVLSGGALLFLFLMCGGFGLFGLLALAGLAGLGLVNYLLWGRRLNRDVAGEREEEELRTRAEAEGWPLPETGHPRHL